MTDLEQMKIERDAYEFWLDRVLMHAGTGFMLTPVGLDGHLQEIKNGEPLDILPPGEEMTAAWIDEQHLQRFPVFEAVALRIRERLVAYGKTGLLEALQLIQPPD